MSDKSKAMSEILSSNYEILRVKSKKVSCLGPSKTSSHPLIYLDMGLKDFVACPYCSKLFTVKQTVDDNLLRKMVTESKK